MRIMIDTHIFIWWLANDPRFALRYKRRIANPENEVFISMATFWEMQIKRMLGKLEIPEDFIDYAEGFTVVPIRMEHIAALNELPPIHRDPFDRMIVAQAKYERLSLISEDPFVRRYFGAK